MRSAEPSPLMRRLAVLLALSLGACTGQGDRETEAALQSLSALSGREVCLDSMKVLASHAGDVGSDTAAMEIEEITPHEGTDLDDGMRSYVAAIGPNVYACLAQHLPDSGWQILKMD